MPTNAKGKRNRDETDLIKAALKYLQLNGVFAWRNNAGVVFADIKGTSRAIKLGPLGSADILGVIPPNGRILAAEAKSPTNRNELTCQQALYLEKIKSLGGVAVVFRSLETLGQAVHFEKSNV